MASFSDVSKNTATFTQAAKHAAAFSVSGKATATTSAGQYIGFGAFTYSGGQTVHDNGATFTNATKH